MGGQNEMTIRAMDLIDGATTCSKEAEGKGGIGGREPHCFLENIWEANPLWEETVRWTE